MRTSFSSAAVSAKSRSPAASAVSERLVRLPASACTLPGEAGGFDGAVEDVAGFDELAAQQLDLPADRVGERDEFALSGRPGNGQGAFGVPFGVGVSVQVELGAGEVGDGVETLRNLGVVEGVDEGGGLSATCRAPGRWRCWLPRRTRRRRRRRRRAVGRRAAGRQLSAVSAHWRIDE